MSDFEVCPVGTQARLAAIELVLDRAEQCAQTEAARADKAEAERDSLKEILDHIPQVEAELEETADRLRSVEAQRDALKAALKRMLPAYREAVALYDPNTDDALTVAARNALFQSGGGNG